MPLVHVRIFIMLMCLAQLVFLNRFKFVAYAQISNNVDLSENVDSSGKWNPSDLRSAVSSEYMNSKVAFLVGTVDGYIYAMNSENQELWKTPLLPGGSLVRSHQIDNSNRKTVAKETNSKLGEEGLEWESSDSESSRPYSVIPTMDGSIVVHSPHGMRKTTVKAQALAEKTPYSSKNGLIFTGHKNSRLLRLDLKNGRIIHDTGAGDGEPLSSSTRRRTSNHAAEPIDHLWIGRVDYTLQAYDDITGLVQFNLTYSELQPLNSSQVLVSKLSSVTGMGLSQATERADIDINYFGLASGSVRDSYAADRDAGPIGRPPALPVVSTVGGDFYIADDAGQFGHSISLGSPAVFAFSVEQRLGKNGESTEVRPLKVLHLPGNAEPHDEEINDPVAAEANSVVVRSHEEGGLYALEMPSAASIQTLVEDLLGKQRVPVNRWLSTPGGDATFGHSNLTPDLSKALVTGKMGRNTDVQVGKNAVATAAKKTYSKLPATDACSGAETAVSLLSYGHDNQAVTVPCMAAALIGKHQLVDANMLELPLPLLVESGLSEFDDFLNKAQTVAYSSAMVPTALDDVGRLLFYIIFAAFTAVILFVLMQRVGLPLPAGLLSKMDLARSAVVRLLVSNPINDAGARSSAIEAVKATDSIASDGDHSTPLSAFTVEKSTNSDVEISVDANGREVQQIGSIQIYSKDILGYGSHGTIVMRGSLNGRPVAVKRMLVQLTGTAEREISLLIRSDGHANVVRYFLREQKGEFVYLALQLCNMSLNDFIRKVVRNANENSEGYGRRNKDGVRPLSHADVPSELKAALLQVCEGLAHLHDQRIVHRDIKPHNILCALPDEILQSGSSTRSTDDISSVTQLSGYVLKISDMGLGKQLGVTEGSFGAMSMTAGSLRGEPLSQGGLTSATGLETQVGTIGWQAPEMLAQRSMAAPLDACVDDNDEVIADISGGAVNSKVPVHSSGVSDGVSFSPNGPHRLTRMLDIFSLGCVLHYVIVPGEHPFGDCFSREANILNKKLNLEHLKQVPEAWDLLARMLRHSPHLRPTAKEVCSHPFFWPASKRLDFLTDLSDRLEHEALDAPAIAALERNNIAIVGGAWDARLDILLQEDIGKYRRYATASVRDLLRLIRNKRHHHNELSEAAKAQVGAVPTGFQLYFDVRFPELLMHCVRMTCNYLADDKICQDYCKACVGMFKKDAKLDDWSASGPAVLLGAVGLSTAVRDSTESPVHSSSSPSSEGSPRSWWLDAHAWILQSNSCDTSKSPRPNHLTRNATDLKYRSRLCSHWESTRGNSCPMKKKGKCDFAHGPLELRVRETRLKEWELRAQHMSRCVAAGSDLNRLVNPDTWLCESAGEDVLNAARMSTSDRSRGSEPYAPTALPPSSAYYTAANMPPYTSAPVSYPHTMVQAPKDSFVNHAAISNPGRGYYGLPGTNTYPSSASPTRSDRQPAAPAAASAPRMMTMGSTVSSASSGSSTLRGNIPAFVPASQRFANLR